MPGVEHVVILEDDPLQRSVQTSIWRSIADVHGFMLHVASDAPAADQIVSSLNGGTLLVFDHEVPGGSGLECLRRARSQRSDVHCVLFTGANVVAPPGVRVDHKPPGVVGWEELAHDQYATAAGLAVPLRHNA